MKPDIFLTTINAMLVLSKRKAILSLRTLWFLLFILITTTGISKTGDPEKTFRDAIAKITDAPSVSADFVMTREGSKLKGNIIASGECFYINAPQAGYETWFDGKTLWTWNGTTDEVNMMQPDAGELQEINPLAIASDSRQPFNSSIVKEDQASIIIALSPKDKEYNGVKKALLTISKSSGFPTNLDITFTDGSKTEFSFSNFKIGSKLKAVDFRYKIEYHPTAEIIDLR